jgi:hypothetical protein
VPKTQIFNNSNLLFFLPRNSKIVTDAGTKKKLNNKMNTAQT